MENALGIWGPQAIMMAITASFTVIGLGMLFAAILVKRRWKPSYAFEFAFIAVMLGLVWYADKLSTETYTAYQQSLEEDMKVSGNYDPAEGTVFDRTFTLIAFQWGFAFINEDEEISRNAVVVKPGQKVLFRIVSNDVIHGFNIPLVVSILYFMLPRVMGTERLHWAGLAQISYWTLIVAAVLLVIGRPDFTWTAYAPMSFRTGNPYLWMGHVAIILVAVSEFLAGAVLFRNGLSGNFKWSQLPLMGWAAIVIGALFMVSVFFLGLAGYGLLNDYMQWTEVAWFDPARGGSIQYFLYLFWSYGHPAVYLPFVPAIAVIYTIMPRFLGHKMWSYWSGVVAFILLGLGAIPIGPHHFQPVHTISGPYERFVQILTMLVFIPSVLHVFNWVSTLFMAPIPASARRAVPFKFMVMAIAYIIYGGATAFINAQIAPDSDFIHNSYWIPAHFHAMFLGFTAQMGIAGVYYLYPYFTGKMFSQRLGNWHWGLWQVGLFLQITGMFVAGYLYFPRWVYDYLAMPGWMESQMVITVGGYLVGLGFLVFVTNIAWSAHWGKDAPADPWPLEMDATGAKAPQPAE